MTKVSFNKNFNRKFFPQTSESAMTGRPLKRGSKKFFQTKKCSFPFFNPPGGEVH